MLRRSSVFVACLTLLVTAAAAFKADEPSGDVVHLTDENFDGLTDGRLPWMVAVTAPWCAHLLSLVLYMIDRPRAQSLTHPRHVNGFALAAGAHTARTWSPSGGRWRSG